MSGALSVVVGVSVTPGSSGVSVTVAVAVTAGNIRVMAGSGANVVVGVLEGVSLGTMVVPGVITTLVLVAVVVPEACCTAACAVITQAKASIRATNKAGDAIFLLMVESNIY